MTYEKKLEIANNYIMNNMPEIRKNADKYMLNGGNQQDLFKFLRNIYLPVSLSDEYLLLEKSILFEQRTVEPINFKEIKFKYGNIFLTKEKITNIKVDAIVNEASEKMLGTFCREFDSVDCQIHTKAGLGLRLECLEIMNKQGHDESIGFAKLTNGYNLPSKFVIHTVPPTVFNGKLENYQKNLLRSCYDEVLTLFVKKQIHSICFPSLAVLNNDFPVQEAAIIAVNSVVKFIKNNNMEVVFSVNNERELEVYTDVLNLIYNRKRGCKEIVFYGSTNK